MNRRLKIGIVIGAVVLMIAGLFIAQRVFFGAPESQEENEIFTAGLKQNESQILDKLKGQGLIKNKIAFDTVLSLKRKHNAIQPGGYDVSKNMTAWQLADKLTGNPDMKWVVIPEGFRKEQIGELLQKTFDWNDDDLDRWNTEVTKMKIDYIEGTYFPDTYLIPVSDSELDIANRMIRNFDEKFAPYVGQFAQQNIKWTTGLKLASVIQREAAGKDDMPLIAGILWNRLNNDMNLEIDATVQYARGKTGDSWWAPVTADEIRNIDSPYNTYKNKGLPPYPIGNPGLPAIEAVLHPTETECLYYIHDNNRQIHCAKTLEEHQANIDKYLKSS
ncbi:MAG TPA: endolytic transglycosylase MltG [Candidatus Moranbacteria bacterium]|nr:endolytic transglycosylase MltG [Candidatus Moranbacteria bacterium]